MDADVYRDEIDWRLGSRGLSQSTTRIRLGEKKITKIFGQKSYSSSRAGQGTTNATTCRADSDTKWLPSWVAMPVSYIRTTRSRQIGAERRGWPNQGWDDWECSTKATDV